MSAYSVLFHENHIAMTNLFRCSSRECVLNVERPMGGICRSEQSELRIPRLAEKIAAQTEMSLIEAISLERQLEARRDLIRIVPSSALPFSKAGHVILAPAH